MFNVDFQKLLKKEMSRKEFLAFSGIAIASMFGIAGTIKELASHAATPTVSTEAESGTLAGGALNVSDSSASSGKAVQFGNSAPPTTFGAGNPTMSRPSGAGYTPIESLLVSGETLAQMQAGVSLNVNTVMARLTTATILTFPAGVFTVSDFNASGSANAILIPKIAKGLWGSGPGKYGDDSLGTVFTMVPNSSTKAQYQPTQSSGQTTPFRLMMHSGAQGDVSYGQFRVKGVTQPHIYHGFTCFAPAGKMTAYNILVNGWAGDNGGPPGETFGFECHQPPDLELHNIEADGRRDADGIIYGAAGMTIANITRGEVHDCYAHHTRAAAFVEYQCFNTNTYNLHVGDSTQGTDRSVASNGINHERTSGNTHWNPVIINPSTTGVHVTHSNAKQTTFGPSVTNGTLKIVNPTFNDAHGNGRLWIQTWHTYDLPHGGCSMDGNVVYGSNGLPVYKHGNIPSIVDSAGNDIADTKLRYIHNYNKVDNNTAWNHVPYGSLPHISE